MSESIFKWKQFQPELTIDKIFYKEFEVYPNEFFWDYYAKDPSVIIKKKLKISEMKTSTSIY